MARPSRLMESIMARIEQQFPPESESDISRNKTELSPKQELEERRWELKNGLTDLQRLFLFGKLSGLNDKDAVVAAGYSLSVAENTKQRIWRPQVRAEYERVCQFRTKGHRQGPGRSRAITKHSETCFDISGGAIEGFRR